MITKKSLSKAIQLTLMGVSFMGMYDSANATSAEIAGVLFNGKATFHDYNLWGACPSNWCTIGKAGYVGGHSGIDIQTQTKGKDQFYSVSNGQVIKANGSGTIAVYDSTRDITTLYLHASAHDVKVGDVVQIGTPLGKQGDVGSAGAFHVHLETRSGRQTSGGMGQGNTIDPVTTIMSYIKSPVSSQLATPAVSSIQMNGNTANMNWNPIQGAAVYRVVVSQYADFRDFKDDNGNIVKHLIKY